jgi:hypothetical protein
MLFSRRRTTSTFNPVIQIGDFKVPASSTGLFLGITLDSKLSWHQHIESKNLSIRRLCFPINRYVRNNWGLSPARMKAVYKTLIIPKWLYIVAPFGPLQPAEASSVASFVAFSVPLPPS